jgi:uncharacterized membrane protein
MKWTTSQHEGVGTHGKGKFNTAGQIFEAEFEVIEWEQNRKLGWRSVAGNFTSFGTYTLEPRGKKTEITSVLNYELPYSILGKMIDKLKMRKQFSKDGRQSLENLKALCEK